MANINDWLSIDKASGTGNAYITLTASSSNELQERIASLSIKTRSKEVFLNVKQLAFNNYFVLGKNLISPLWEGGSYSNYVLSNISWTYTSSDWISLSVTSGSVGRTEFNVIAQPNTSEETRIGFVNIVASNGVMMGTIKVAQASHNEVNNIIFYTSTDGNKITPYSSTGVVANEYVDGVGALYYANTITEVPQNLFRNKDTLVSVSIPETVTTIKSGAFYDCDKLASYDFPDALTTIEADAFRYCDSLTIFDFPYVETIGDYAFNECPFETVILSDTLKTTGKGVFQTCTKLKTIQIGSGLTSVSESLCNGCTSLETINIPNTIKRIEQNAFLNCTAIETLNLHGGIEYIGYRAFYGNKIKSVTLGERTNALEQGEEPFKASTPFMADAYVTDIKSWFLWKPYLFTSKNSVRNLYVNGELLTIVVTPTDYDTVPEYAFYKNPHITRVVVTDNVTSIGSGAFNGLNNANYLYLGSGASYSSNTFTDFDGTLELNNTNSQVLGNNYFTKVVFMSNTKVSPKSHTIQEIEFRGDVLNVSCAYNDGYDTFKNVIRAVVNCNQLHIGEHLLQGASLLTEFDFRKVVSVGESAFADTSITELTNAPLLTSIGHSAFRNTSITKLTNIPLLTSIDNMAFADTKLKIVDLSNSHLSSIGNSAFLNCNELTEVILPSSSYTIDSYAFQGCSNLKHIKMVAEDIETEEREIAKLSNSVYNTGINATVNSRLEFDYKYTQSPSGDAYYEIIGAGNTDDDNVFQIRIQNNVFHFHIGSSQFGVSGITPNVFHHFVVSLDEGVIIDGASKGTFSRSDRTINAPFYINGIQYALARHANGEFGTFKIDDTIITPKEDGFYNGSTKLDVVKSGEYEYKKEIIILNAPAIPTIKNNTFYEIAQYGFLEYPLVLDYSSWLSTNSYYLGYYNWNKFNLSTNELDFDAANTYEVTVNNGIPTTWEITKLPFWLSASVMSGGEGTTTITFTKIADYVETDDIIISIMGTNYVIKAKYTVRTLDFTEQDTYVLNISNTTSITDVEWLTETFDTETVTLKKTIIVYDDFLDTLYINVSNGKHKLFVKADSSNAPLPKADNRIYYTGSVGVGSNIIYGTNAEYVGNGYYGGGLRYLEYDRPITRIDGVFAEGSGIKRLSLPSTLLYLVNAWVRNDNINGEYILGGQAFHTDTLQEVDFGGNELYIGNYSFHSSNLRKFNLPKTVRVLGRCSFGGKSPIQNFGTDTLNIGANMKLIAAGAFAGMGNINRINFYGMTPPTFEVWYNANKYVYAFANINPSCEVHIPIGADYSSLRTNGGLPSTCAIIADLTAEEPTTYEASMWLDGGHSRIKPNSPCFMYFYNAETNSYGSTSPFTVYNNTTTEMINKTVTINDVSATIEVRCCQGDIIIEQYATLNRFYVTLVNNVSIGNSVSLTRRNVNDGTEKKGFSFRHYGETLADGRKVYYVYDDNNNRNVSPSKLYEYYFGFKDYTYGDVYKKILKVN